MLTYIVVEDGYIVAAFNNLSSAKTFKNIKPESRFIYNLVDVDND